jgi:hypothetical protein
VGTNDDQLSKQDQENRADEVSHVRRRAIQAPVAALLLRAFGQEIGHERAIAVATAAVQADAAEAGREMARQCGGNSMADLARVVRDVWCRDDGMRIQVLEESERAFRFDVTHCGYAAAYAELGIQDLGVCLSCCRDEPFARAFNPRIKLTRRGTIMEGATCCDFQFTME